MVSFHTYAKHDATAPSVVTTTSTLISLLEQSNPSLNVQKVFLCYIPRIYWPIMVHVVHPGLPFCE